MWKLTGSPLQGTSLIYIHQKKPVIAPKTLRNNGAIRLSPLRIVEKMGPLRLICYKEKSVCQKYTLYDKNYTVGRKIFYFLRAQEFWT